MIRLYNNILRVEIILQLGLTNHNLQFATYNSIFFHITHNYATIWKTVDVSNLTLESDYVFINGKSVSFANAFIIRFKDILGF